MTTLSRVDSNVHSESAAATQAMAILPILYLSSSDARSKVVAKVETNDALVYVSLRARRRRSGRESRR